MDQKLKPWELALMAGILISLVISTFGHNLKVEQNELADSLIRFHVIANSDSDEDQNLKLMVRDRVLAETEQVYPENGSLEEVQEALSTHLDQLAGAGDEVVQAQGFSYPVTASLEHCWFPTKEYDGFTLPAGYYDALRIVIGEGRGHNWWCVAFPPLCISAASETLDSAVQAGYFTEEQVKLVTEQDGGYVLKLKGLELLGRLQRFLKEQMA